MDVPVQYDLGWEISQVLFIYFQMYIVPLVLMCMLSALTIYRRELSSNRVYFIQGLEDNRRQEQQLSTASGTIIASVIAALSRVQFATRPPREEEPASARAATQDTSEDPSQFDRNLLGDMASDLRNLNWSRHARDAMGSIAARLPQVARNRLSSSSFVIFPMHGRRRRHAKDSTPLHPDKFPADVQVNVFSFLHPKDVARFACVSRTCKDIVDGDGTTTAALWKTLWQRDYGWLMQSWEIGREVLERSNVQDPRFDKELYFRFGLSLVNYLLAGLNTPDLCLVGLHGNLYDITHFVTSHPGSPDTLLVHAGRDATKLFDDMDHSRRARNLARGFCIAVDASSSGSYGYKPTVAFQDDGPTPEIVEANPVITKKKRRLKRRQCLQQCYEAFIAEEVEHRKRFRLKMKAREDVLHWNMFYDPFQGAWKVWYTNKDFETVFM